MYLKINYLKYLAKGFLPYFWRNKQGLQLINLKTLKFNSNIQFETISED